MRLLDNDAINYVLMNDISLEGEYFVTPDVEEEMSVAEIVHKKKAPRQIRSLALRHRFDEALYLKNYFDTLNQYGRRSFFGMRGFGDVSIVAAVRTLVQAKNNGSKTLPLPGIDDGIEVYTGDEYLTKTLRKEFSNNLEIYAKVDLGA